MNDLKGPPAELRFTVTIKRAKTGAVETYEMRGESDLDTIKRIVDAGGGVEASVAPRNDEP